MLGAGTAALSIATALRLRRAEVDVIATGSVFASELGAPGRNRLVHDTRQIGVRCHAGATLDRFVPAGLHWISDKGRTQFSSADFVVAAEQVEPVETLRFRPRRERRTWCVGASASAHFIEGAMRSASDVAAEIAAYAREHR